eukprot:CAMPEP_0184660598 /NCGR_PEP_ID=MMETSP0308-20130426/34391_1 /TAXON_ID=38269 /ORGANISM="Gloeochaete witrockiana, Strain SAG 46.84" /LENGTH=464 /DNA_ID=CAMNT_0027101283 /DNA_START=32 /DNA_END=1426 /DNA_ORIENTATION=+
MSGHIGPSLPSNRKDKSKRVDSIGKSKDKKEEEESIGPSMPPGWRKRGQEEEEEEKDIGPSMPPGWKRKGQEDEEVEKNIGPSMPPGWKKNGHEENEEMDIGPSMPPGWKKRRENDEEEKDIGPCMPPGLKKKGQKEEEEEEEEQDIGPSMPPGLKKKGQQEEEEEEEKKDIGPSIPPSHRTSSSTTEDHRGGSSSSTSHASSSANRHAVEKSAQPMSEESSTTGSSAPKKRLGPSLPPVDWRPPVDEDDLIGPRPSMGVFDHMDDEEEDEEVKMEQKRKREHAEAVAWCKARGLPLPQEEGEKGGREEWMTALPAEKNPFLPVGPVIQTRGFSRKEEAPAKQDTSWTDTPADRARKAKEAALAKKKKRPSEDIFAEVVSKSAQRADQEVATNIDAYNSVKRPKSLLEEHAEAQKKNPKKDEYVGWDRDRDFTSRPIDPKTRNKMIKESKGLNGMFNLDTRKFL